MASKVNTRFVLIVVLAIGAALALLGGVYVLKLRGDATRSYRKGMAALERGDNKAAHDQFARALNKDPGNPEYLKRVEETLLTMVPANSGEAQELYSRYVAVLGHAVLHQPKNAETHLRMLHELHSNARRLNYRRAWEMVKSSSESMAQQLADGDAAKPLARVYRALAMSHLSTVESDENLEQALGDLDAAAATLSNNDLAEATEVGFRMAFIEKMRVSGKSRTSIEAKQDELAKIMERAIERVPNGPEVARAQLMYLLVQRFGGGAATQPASRADNSAVASSAAAGAVPTVQQVRQVAERAIGLLTAESDPGLVTETVGLVELVPQDGPTMALGLMKRMLEAHPQQFDYRLYEARLYFRDGQLDQAVESAERVLISEQLPVSFLSQVQFDLRRQAAGLCCDVAYQRWLAASDEQKSAQLDKMSAARDRLAGMVADPQTDRLVLRAEGKIAFARQNFGEAAQKFERLTRDTGDNDAEVLSFAAASLANVGQIGLAHERLSRALTLNPGYVPWIVDKASMELRMGRTEDANRTIQDIPDTALSDARTQQVVTAVRRSAGGAAAPTDDPVQAAVATASEALTKNEIDNARAALLAALQDHADAIVLYQGLAEVEMRANDRAKAREYVDRGLQLKGDDKLLKQLDVGLRIEDPIQAVVESFNLGIENDKQRRQALLMSMASITDQQRRQEDRLRQAGDADGANKAHDLAERAEAEARKAAEALASSNPEDPLLLDYRFSRALRDKQWNQAGDVASIAKRINADGAGGLLFQGRLELARENYPAAISALEGATDRLDYSSGAWRLLALAYQSDGNFAQAERAYEQAYRCNPNDIEGARAYLSLLKRRGDETRALQILRSVHRLAPQDVTLREAWLDLENEVGDRATALHERTKLYQTSPSDHDNAASLAKLLVSLEPTRDVILDDAGQPRFGDGRWVSMGTAEQERERSQARERWQKFADEIIEGLSKDLGDDLRVAVLRAAAQRERGDIVAGEETLRAFIARHDKSQNEDMFVELGRYQAAVSHYADAIDSLVHAVALAGPKQRDAEVNLATLQMQLRQYDEALKNLESALAKRDDQTTRLQIVECLARLGRFDDAEKRLKETTTGAGGSVTTLLAASIAEGRAVAMVAKNDLTSAERLFAEQRDLLAKAEQQDPTNPMPRILLARSLLDEYERTKRSTTLLDDALMALDRADRIRAGTPEVSTVRVAVFKAKGDLESATSELKRSLQTNPNNVIVRRDLIQSLLDAQHGREALEALEAAIRENPTLAVWHEMRGDLKRAAGDAREAAVSYDKAYQLTPSTSMLLKLANAMLESNPKDCRSAADRLALRTADFQVEPLLRETYARALSCLGQREQAVEQLRAAYAQWTALIKDGKARPGQIRSWYVALMDVYLGEDPSGAERLVMEVVADKPGVYDLSGLAQVWIRAGDAGLSRAVELQRQAIALCPTDDSELRAILNGELGGFLVLANDLPGAAEAFAIMVKLQPLNADALNNLAYITAEELNKPKEALPMAERLLELAPGNGAILDTVGWVYYLNGDLEKAKKHLSQALTILPLADTYVHLATVLWAEGDAVGAEKQMVEAEKLRPSKGVQEKIKALRDDIQKGKRPGG